MKHESDSTPIEIRVMAFNSAKEKEFHAIEGDGPSGCDEGATGRCADGGSTAAAQRRGAPGVCSSNTPPQSSKNTNPADYWTAAEDWLEWAFYVDWGINWPKLSRELSKAKETAAIKHCPEEQHSILFWGGRVVLDSIGTRLGNRRNGPYFAYKMQFGYMTVLIAEQAEPHKTKPSVVLRASGDACLIEGAKTCYEEGYRLIKELGGTVISNKLSRVDICLDMPGNTMKTFDRAYIEERYICRAKSHGRYSSGGITVQFGKYPTMLRIYDKLAEVKKKKNPTQTIGMVCNRWGGSMPKSAIRVEFKLGRDFLKKKGVDSVEDYYRKRGALLNYLTHGWMRFTRDPVDRANKNQSKSPTLPLWEQIRETFLIWADTDPNQPLAPLDKAKANVAHLIKVAVGVLKTAAFDQGLALKTPEELTDYLLKRIKLYGVDIKTG